MECEVDGRRTGTDSGALADVAELAVEFFLALDDRGPAAPAVALLMAKLAARGDETGGGE